MPSGLGCREGKIVRAYLLAIEIMYAMYYGVLEDTRIHHGIQFLVQKCKIY